MKKIIYFTNIFPHYRKAIWKKLLSNRSFNLEIYFSNADFHGIKTANLTEGFYAKEINQLQTLKNFSVSGIVFWQSKVILKCLFSKMDTAIFLGEMTVISTWISALICRIRSKKVVFWGHALYGNESKLKLFFRLMFYKLANNHLLYGNRAKSLLVKMGFDSEKLYIIYNSLDYEVQKKLFFKLERGEIQKNWNYFNNNLPVVLFIGRLTKQKKLHLLINTLTRLNKDTPRYNMLIIGDGPEKEFLEELSNELLQKKLCCFVGPVYEETKIANYLYYSDLCVSPGNVGLTAIHALSYGTPVCTHDNFCNQMPDYESIISFENGFFFQEGNLLDLERKILLWFDQYHGKRDRKSIRAIIDLKYNPDYQLSVFKKAI